MGKTVCTKDTCTGCMACTNVCPKNAITINDNLRSYNAEIKTDTCINCGLCHKVCPNCTECEMKPPIYWKQGWAKDEIRLKSSSGGAATALIQDFILSGGYVASCLFEEGEFRFSITNNIDETRKYTGSKYVKSNPQNVYKEIKRLLGIGEKVLFVGLPCQSAAVQNVCGANERLFTVDLICHGTPSPILLKKYLEEKGYDWNETYNIQFRNNEYFGLSRNGKRLMPNRVTDSYLTAFLHGIDYTENCYSCRYATIKRVSDVTLGDAWGLLSESISGGVSLILCQTQKGIDLIEKAGLHLEEADLEKAIEANHQLKYPSIKHPAREGFFSRIEKGYSMDRATFMASPKEMIKQKIKTVLIYTGIIKDRSVE